MAQIGGPFENDFLQFKAAYQWIRKTMGFQLFTPRVLFVLPPNNESKDAHRIKRKLNVFTDPFSAALDLPALFYTAKYGFDDSNNSRKRVIGYLLNNELHLYFCYCNARAAYHLIQSPSRSDGTLKEEVASGLKNFGEIEFPQILEKRFKRRQNDLEELRSNWNLPIEKKIVIYSANSLALDLFFDGYSFEFNDPASGTVSTALESAVRDSIKLRLI